MTLQSIVLSLLISSMIISAQTVNPAGRPSMEGGRRQYPAGGTITVDPHPGILVTSLRHMVSISPLIIEGTVQLGLQPINRDPNIPHLIETHFEIAVQSVLAGKIPGDARTIILIQRGGKVGSWETLVPDDPLLKTGEHYILFLNPEKPAKGQPANTTGRPRYYAVGTWAGKVKVEDSKVHFLPRAVERFKEYDNADLDTFLAVLKGTINHTIVPPARNRVPFPLDGATITEGTGPTKK